MELVRIEANSTQPGRPMKDADDGELRRRLEDINREAALRVHDRESDFWKTNNDAAIKSGEEAIKALILINGGSSVAMLAFIGTLASKDQHTSQQIATLARPLVWFASGVGLAVVAACFSYFTNISIARLSRSRLRTWEHPYLEDGNRSRRWGIIVEVLRMVAIAMAALSLATFFCGVWTAKRSFEQPPTSSTPSANAPAPPQTVPTK
jgi:hypothetical protein